MENKKRKYRVEEMTMANRKKVFFPEVYPQNGYGWQLLPCSLPTSIEEANKIIDAVRGGEVVETKIHYIE